MTTPVLMSDTDIISDIIAAAKKKWPEPYFDSWVVKRNSSRQSYHGGPADWTVFVSVTARLRKKLTNSVAEAPTLPALLANLKAAK